VLFIVFITTIVLGALMPAYIKCSLNRASQSLREIDSEESELTIEQGQQGLINNKPKKPGFFKTMDDNFFKPWFIRDYSEKK